MIHNREKRQRGALERRQRDVTLYLSILDEDPTTVGNQEYARAKLQAAERDVDNLKRKLGIS